MASALGLWLSVPALTSAKPAEDQRIKLEMDASEAEAVLAILAARSKGGLVKDSAWRQLFQSEPYLRLKRREASFHRGFTDADFWKFVLSDDLAKQAPLLRRTLDEWLKSDAIAAAERALTYLPANATIRAKIYPVIKPITNSFVFEAATDPAIFLYLDPKVTKAKLENTVAHELHHIGYASVKPAEGKPASPKDPSQVRAALNWMSAFGEGFAMLAAAGSVDVHPHAASESAERDRWDRDMANLEHDFKALEKFFLDVIDVRLKTQEAIREQGYSFFGVQGPWYTVGYKMATIIEKQEGRAELIECMSSPRKLLASYNRDAAALNEAGKGEKLPRWSNELLAKIGKAPTK